MSATSVNAAFFGEMLQNGYRNLKLNMSAVDDLNVFPVPDGDTGKNMTMTVEGGINAVSGDEDTVHELMKKVSKGALLSARGNSGVILSQFIRGISEGCADMTDLDAKSFLNAMQSGVSRAYSSVIEPVEGTMLTVMREGYEFASKKNCADLEACFEYLVSEMKRSLARTPELLDVLREAGVVDSGGAGLLLFFEGMLKALKGETVSVSDAPVSAQSFSLAVCEEDKLLTYGYCTEFILQLQSSKTDISAFDIDGFIKNIETYGNSIVAVRDENLVKVHIHSFVPEQVIAFARKYGEFLTIKIENMAVQHNETIASAAKREHVRYAVVTTATGKGMTAYFKDIGASAVIDGGRTNNPSAGDFIAEFKKLDADYILVLPNDGNIILAANQAADIYKDSVVRVVPTKSLAEGYSALSMMDLSRDTVDEVISDMTYYLPNVTTGYISVSTRDADIDGVKIKKGEYLGFTDEKIYSSEKDKISAAEKLFKTLENMPEKQVVTVFRGKDATDAELEEIQQKLSEVNPLLDIGVIDAGQEVYDFIFAIE